MLQGEACPHPFQPFNLLTSQPYFTYIYLLFNPLKYKLIILLSCLVLSASAFSQYPSFSVGTDLGLVHNFPKGQRFTALNHTIITDFHLSEKQGVQISFGYCTAGKYGNLLDATALDPGTVPQKIQYSNRGKMRIRMFSVDWKHYLKGTPTIEKGWGLYTKAGFGLLMGWVDNAHNRVIDTAAYYMPVRSGNANFKRLTLNLALGWEKCLGADFYFYTEGRVSVPSSDYPSPYLLVNDNAPFTALVCGGLRILF